MSDKGPEPGDEKFLRQLMKKVNIISLVALLILLGTFTLILISMFSENAGLLGEMSEPRFARGLITYLFAVVTIGAAVVLLIAGLTNEVTEDSKQKFEHGKDVLSLLLGVFGTIVGFYFGSADNGANSALRELNMTPPKFDSAVLTAGQPQMITAFVTGGTPPYRFGIALDSDAEPDFFQSVDPSGWLSGEFVAPEADAAREVSVTLGVKDAAGKIFTVHRALAVTPAQ